MTAREATVAAPDRGYAPALRIGAVALQLGLLVLVLFRFQLESSGLRNLTLLALGGFVVHGFLPLAQRLRFFAVLSLAAVVLVLGLTNALWLFGLGGVLIAACHLPWPFKFRVATVAAIGIGLALLLAFKVETPWSNVVWPVLASMFMFRIIVYLYDLRYSELTPEPSSTIAYFFLLPNVCFPLFPVVDYEVFRKSHYAGDASEIYQRGIRWMVRGVVHLIFYRAVYYYFVIDPKTVASTTDMLRFMLSSFLLYLRVSGQFHLIVGMLLLFGFALPRTNNFYYLASSFTDFWRRINIYWKDFMMKIFFYPVHFRLRKMGQVPAMMLATFVVFVITWFLHAYQWFWLGGTFLFALHDILFWVVLAALVLVNAYREIRYGRKRTLRPGRWTLPGRTAGALRTLATFITLCTLWSMWSSDSFAQWLSLWPSAGNLWIVLAVIVVVSFVTASLVDRIEGRVRESRWPQLTSFWQQGALSAVSIVLLLAASVSASRSILGPEISSVVGSLREAKLNRHDLATLERGYYEQLTNVNQHNASLMEVYNKRPFSWKRIQETEAWRETDDLMLGELQPDSEIVFKKAHLSVNHWGMRDREYSLEKPEGVYRVALLGSSHVMGSGVNDDETFEARLEDGLNQGLTTGGPSGYEILNFAEAGRNLIQLLYRLETRVPAFAPDAVFLVGHPQDDEILARYLPALAASEVEIPWPYLRDLFARADVAHQPPAIIERRLAPYLDEIRMWAYRSVAEQSRKLGARPFWILLPMVYEQEVDDDPGERIRAMEALGYIVLDLTGVYRGEDESALRLAAWDDHPNAHAHQLISDRLYEMLSVLDGFAPGTMGTVAAPTSEASPQNE